MYNMFIVTVLNQDVRREPTNIEICSHRQENDWHRGYRKMEVQQIVIKGQYIL